MRLRDASSSISCPGLSDSYPVRPPTTCKQPALPSFAIWLPLVAKSGTILKLNHSKGKKRSCMSSVLFPSNISSHSGAHICQMLSVKWLQVSKLLCSRVVFISDTHDGAGAPRYRHSVCYESRATYLLFHQKKTISLLASQFSPLQTLICLFYKSTHKANCPMFLMWSVKRRRARGDGELQWEFSDAEFDSYSQSVWECICYCLNAFPGLRGQRVFMCCQSMWALMNGGHSILHDCLLNWFNVTQQIAFVWPALFLCALLCGSFLMFWKLRYECQFVHSSSRTFLYCEASRLPPVHLLTRAFLLNSVITMHGDVFTICIIC